MLAKRLQSALRDVVVLPFRMQLETPGVRATVPMLRGVWGAALHDLDADVYREVFAPCPTAHAPAETLAGSVAMVDGGTQGDSTCIRRAVPGYVMRPAPPDPDFAPALEWILIGEAVRHEHLLRRAWDIASGMGLGPERIRFHMRRVVGLAPSGSVWLHPNPWTLDQCVWPLATPDSPCRFRFSAPLRLLRRESLITGPTLSDLVVAACRRARAFLPAERLDEWADLAREALALSRTIPARPWQGRRLDLHRYSARQCAELDLRGISGALELTEGPGELWPLIVASQWLHIGKGTVMGLGCLQIEPC
ncbi:MAG: CRISPR system precrRNA processing endoribonuclease RAMP protein Cas6 [Planctomycetota bacterium]